MKTLLVVGAVAALLYFATPAPPPVEVAKHAGTPAPATSTADRALDLARDFMGFIGALASAGTQNAPTVTTSTAPNQTPNFVERGAGEADYASLQEWYR